MRLTALELIKQNQTYVANRRYAYVAYALQGEVTYASSKADASLSPKGGALLVANAGEGFSLSMGPSALAVVCRLNMGELRRTLNDRAVFFVCDPSLRHQAAYSELARCLDALLAAESETGDFAAFRRNVAELTLLRCLLDGFGGAAPSAPTRAEQFMDYVDAHYAEPISLAQMADFFGLSPEHLSKVFKREVGTTFHAYLSHARLDVATERLCEGDHTVTRIALESGFPNVASFNQAFKARHGTTPMGYRKARAQSERTEASRAIDGTVMAQISERSFSGQEDHLHIDAAAHQAPLHASWHSVIGLGPVGSLAIARVREQALWLKRHLSFERWRVTCDLAAFMDGHDRYDVTDSFDFLVGNGFVPHIALDRAQGTDAAAYVAAFREFLQHCVNRYSVETIRRWRFEVPLLDWEGGAPFAEHFHLMGEVARLLDRYGIAPGPLGPGILPDQRCDNLRSYLLQARLRGIEPAQVTISCRPVSPTGAGSDALLVRTADRYYLRSQVLMAREVLAEEGFDPDRLCVSSWRDSLENSNIVNDSCYEGASIVQTVLSSWNLVESVCYNDALDISTQGGTTAQFLSGRPGILSRDGIPKPSYYALDFLSHVGEDLIFANERCLASGNRMGNYQIVLHNCERLNAVYLATPEDKLDWRELRSYFDNPGERSIQLHMSNVRPGTYLIKKRFVNERGGSVGDAAARARLWCMDEPSRSETAFLKATAVPQLLLERVLVGADGQLTFALHMQSNEIAYCHVIYLY